MNQSDRNTLLELARDSIEFTLNDPEHGRILINAQDYKDSLQQIRASFVTLTLNNQLRGCVGNLEAYQALVLDVAQNAHSAAFKDPRFAPLSIAEFPDVAIHISILSPPQLMQCDSESELLQQLKPGEDGLILEAEGHRATFLPSVWEQLPNPVDFLQQLKRKANLPLDYWSERIKVQRYHTESFQ